ncbi:MAG: hypothetical protein AB7G68_07900 [Nitrospiraceae bacterium]
MAQSVPSHPIERSVGGPNERSEESGVKAGGGGIPARGGSVSRLCVRGAPARWPAAGLRGAPPIRGEAASDRLTDLRRLLMARRDRRFGMTDLPEVLPVLRAR